MQAIPRLDLGAYRAQDPSVRARFAAALRDGLSTFGFVTLEGHGISSDLVRRVYAHFQEFFARGEEEKLACSGVAGGQRGFTPLGVEHARDAAVPDAKEFYHVGQPSAAERGNEALEDSAFAEEIAGYPANVWPMGAADFRRDALQMFRELEACAAQILRALEEAFSLPDGSLADMVRGGNSILRGLHYPPLGKDPLPGTLRAAAHEDINLITLLCEASDSGLEILEGGGDGVEAGSARWRPVEVEPGQIVVDAGDMLSRVTNDVIPSTTHRVVSSPAEAERHRYSLPFFAHPRPSCDLSVMKEFVTELRPCAYPPITAGAFLTERLGEIGLLGEARAHRALDAAKEQM